ncbi:hypothetical protein quinque_005735 [Culex quinquefasciatus]
MPDFVVQSTMQVYRASLIPTLLLFCLVPVWGTEIGWISPTGNMNAPVAKPSANGYVQAPIAKPPASNYIQPHMFTGNAGLAKTPIVTSTDERGISGYVTHKQLSDFGHRM